MQEPRAPVSGPGDGDQQAFPEERRLLGAGLCRVTGPLRGTVAVSRGRVSGRCLGCGAGAPMQGALHPPAWPQARALPGWVLACGAGSDLATGAPELRDPVRTCPLRTQKRRP